MSDPVPAPRTPDVRPFAGPAEAEPQPPASRLFELVLDNLPAWTVVAMTIGLLYIVWATIEILTHYVGGLPGIKP